MVQALIIGVLIIGLSAAATLSALVWRHQRDSLVVQTRDTPLAVTIGVFEASGQAATPTVATAAAWKFDGDLALEHVGKLVSFGPRVSGSIEEGSAADYIELTLINFGYNVSRQAFRAPNGQIANNILAVKPGTAPRSATITPPWLGIGAHYDTVSGTTGANDNASGVSVVLETARIMRQASFPYDLRFMLFSSEENENPARDSYAGSLAYVGDLTEAGKDAAIGYINIDMVGWPEAGYAIGNLRRGDRFLVELGAELAAERGVEFVKDRGYSVRLSDHQSFEKAGLPTVSFGAATYPFHHQPEDSLDKVGAAHLQTLGSLISVMLDRLAGA